MSHIDAYWAEGFSKVEGWVHGGMLRPLKLVDEIQRGAGIKGHAAEIGVYHGKFFIALGSLLPTGGKITALDVFEDQSFNLDGSGEGNLARVKENVSRYGRRDIDHTFIKADSTTLTVLDRVNLVRDRGPFRLFSVDGCHTTEHTLADLRTAEDCIAPGGVIILDDYMQPHWPGVTEAVGVFCRGVPRVVPFLYAYHKLFFVGLGWHGHFVAACQQALSGHDDLRTVPMFGRSVASIYP
jgi:hypothetical protein